MWSINLCGCRQVEWGRFLRELGAELPVLEEFAGEEESGMRSMGDVLPSGAMPDVRIWGDQKRDHGTH